MNFEWALGQLREGHKVRSSRTPTIWLSEKDKEFYYQTKDGVYNYLGITVDEILAKDWELADTGERSILFKRIDNHVGFSNTKGGIRILHCFARHNDFCKRHPDFYQPIVFFGDIVCWEENALLRMPYFGKVSLNILKSELYKFGLHIGMELLPYELERLQELRREYNNEV